MDKSDMKANMEEEPIKPTSGFLTPDGKFFPTKEQANYEWAMTVLLMAMEYHEVSADALIWINELEAELIMYLLAKRAFENESTKSEQKPEQSTIQDDKDPKHV